MTIEETLRAIVAEAHLNPIEERVILLHFGLFGSPKMTLAEMVVHLKQDESVTVKQVTKEWLRQKQGAALVKMRGAMVRMRLDFAAFSSSCTEEPYRSLSEVLIGF